MQCVKIQNKKSFLVVSAAGAQTCGTAKYKYVKVRKHV